jgi:hypothetical protein
MQHFAAFGQVGVGQVRVGRVRVGQATFDHVGRTAGRNGCEQRSYRSLEIALFMLGFGPFNASTNQSMRYDAMGHANQCVPSAKESKMNPAAHNLMFDAFHHNDMSGLAAFAKRAKGRRSKEIAEHVVRLQTSMALYDRSPDGEAETVCEAMEREEDWLKDQLERGL